MSRQLKSLVTIVIFVIQLRRVVNGLNDSSDHESHISALSEVRHLELREWDVSKYHILENVSGLIKRGLGLGGSEGFDSLDLRSNVLKSLVLSQNV